MSEAAVSCIAGIAWEYAAPGQRGHAHNYAELHPVTELRIIAGCS